jgi:hypothetical protein
MSGRLNEGTTVRRTLTAAAVVLALAACGGETGPSGVEGVLRQIGGPAPGFDRPTAGTVTVYPDTGEGDGQLIVELIGVEPVARFGTDSTGEFRIDLPPGTYLLTAVFVQGHPCSAQRVEVEVGQYPVITVTCPIE